MCDDPAAIKAARVRQGLLMLMVRWFVLLCSCSKAAACMHMPPQTRSLAAQVLKQAGGLLILPGVLICCYVEV